MLEHFLIGLNTLPPSRQCERQEKFCLISIIRRALRAAEKLLCINSTNPKLNLRNVLILLCNNFTKNFT